ncbi:MAG: NAD(P)-binding domain-containing protein, partial [Pseudomonadota bacterium]|nr:NAD(P)-binding domain-containing protein [Pseudomonadota bacterium]
MNVSIFGSGNMARGIGYRLVAGGHSVTLFGRDAGRLQKLADELGQVARPGTAAVKTATIGSRIHDEIVVLAMWYSGNLEIAARLSGELAGKTVIEISNALNETYDGLTLTSEASAAEQVQALLPRSHVVKAFNTTFAQTLAEGQVAG